MAKGRIRVVGSGFGSWSRGSSFMFVAAQVTSSLTGGTGDPEDAEPMLCPVSVTGAECLTVSDLYRKNRGIDRSGQTLTHFHRAAAVAGPVGAAKFCSAAKFCWTFCSTQVPERSGVSLPAPQDLSLSSKFSTTVGASVSESRETRPLRASGLSSDPKSLDLCPLLPSPSTGCLQ